MSTMKFCRECNNILYPKEDRDQKLLLYACRNCDHQEVAENYCVYRNEVHHSAAERTQVLQDVAADPTLPRTKDVQCAECKHHEAVFFQAEIMPTGNGQRRGRHDVVLRLLQPKLWASLERLRRWEGLRCMFPNVRLAVEFKEFLGYVVPPSNNSHVECILV
ncbi:unnamed protein product [Linum tenue]|uniref:DNA-directed RNA polymerase II subunit RPB9-like zinc ribbon domain-containing protein n=1 Tax=Linum tenue TaxID=586396 RepID=A0AAV0S0L1_9ROSI|nr:unnamed protein product [Linum tenue]